MKQTRITHPSPNRYKGRTNAAWKKLQHYENLEEKYDVNIEEIETILRAAAVFKEYCYSRKEKIVNQEVELIQCIINPFVGDENWEATKKWYDLNKPNVCLRYIEEEKYE